MSVADVHNFQNLTAIKVAKRQIILMDRIVEFEAIACKPVSISGGTLFSFVLSLITKIILLVNK